MNIEFNYQGLKILIPSNKEERFESACQRFCTKANIILNDLSFLYQGQVLKDEMKLNIEKFDSSIDKKRNLMSVVVIDNENISKEKKMLVKSKNIICPRCGEISEIKIEDYRFTICGCKNKHNTSNLKINKLEENQYIDISKIICDYCKTIAKSETYNNYFYRCNLCKINICPLCKLKHNETQKNHKAIKYDEKYFICEEHNFKFNSYCKNCSMNLCTNCLGEHQNHDIISFVKIINENELDIKALESNLDKIKHNLDIIKNKWKNLSEKIEENINYFQNFCDFYENAIANYDCKNQAYEILKNLINFRDSHIFSNINNLIQLNDFDFFNQMMNINYNINTPNIDELIISYKIDKNEPRIKLFSQNFFNNNKDKCYLLINGDKKDLIKEYEVNNFKDCILTIKLVGLNNITDISSMFRDCTSLLFIPNLSEINTFRFTNFSQIFYGCTSLASLPDISNWNTFNVKSFDYMFGNCPKLESLPDISKWNTMNTTDFTGMFYLCSSLKTMPDISKWNTSRVTSISYIFSGCTSLDLKEIKGISRWDTSSLIYATQMIKGCPGSLDDQSNFELSKTFGNFFNIFF